MFVSSDIQEEGYSKIGALIREGCIPENPSLAAEEGLLLESSSQVIQQMASFGWRDPGLCYMASFGCRDLFLCYVASFGWRDPGLCYMASFGYRNPGLCYTSSLRF